MAHADTIRTNAATYETIADAIDGALTSYGQSAGFLNQTTNSTTFIAVTGRSVSVTVATGEKVKISFYATIGGDGTSNLMYFTVYEDGVDINPTSEIVQQVIDNTSVQCHIAASFIRSAAVGNRTYALYMKSGSGARTVKTNDQILTVEVFQNT